MFQKYGNRFWGWNKETTYDTEKEFRSLQLFCVTMKVEVVSYNPPSFYRQKDEMKPKQNGVITAVVNTAKPTGIVKIFKLIYKSLISTTILPN